MRRMIATMLIVFLFPIVSMAGWERDATGVKYQNDDGSYKTGWYQDIDQKWYYLDDSTGYALINTVTPDGYTVDESGVWIDSKKGNFNMEKYKNNTDFEVTAYASGISRIKEFDNALPVTVHYNNEYICDGGRIVKILDFEVSKDGVLYVQYSMSEPTYYYEFNAITRYVLEDGTTMDVEHKIGKICTQDEKAATAPLMDYYGKKSDPKPVSAEVYINATDVK